MERRARFVSNVLKLDGRSGCDVLPTLFVCSYRTPLCILFPPRIIASACFTLAQMHFEGPNAAPLDARISTPAPSTTLPTPPSHNPTSPNPTQDLTRFVANFFSLSESELKSVAEALTILIQFYASQDSIPHVSSLGDIKPPTISPSYPTLFGRLALVTDQKEKANNVLTPAPLKSQTPHPSAEGVLGKPQP